MLYKNKKLLKLTLTNAIFQVDMIMDKQKFLFKYWLTNSFIFLNTFNESFLLSILVDYKLLVTFLKNIKGTIIDYYSSCILQERGFAYKLFLNMHFLYGFCLLIIKPFFVNTVRFFISLANLEKSTGWLEREIWDMFGIVFLGHKNLRRILSDYGFLGFGLRKNFNITGYIEQRYFDEVNSSYYSSILFSQVFRNLKKTNPWK